MNMAITSTYEMVGKRQAGLLLAEPHDRGRVVRQASGRIVGRTPRRPKARGHRAAQVRRSTGALRARHRAGLRPKRRRTYGRR